MFLILQRFIEMINDLERPITSKRFSILDNMYWIASPKFFNLRVSIVYGTISKVIYFM
jgi:hypothetical protein